MKWKFDISEYFENVRELMDEEIETPRQCMLILNELEKCCDALTPDARTWWVYYEDFRDFKTEIHEAIELIDDEDSYEDCMETVNYYLTDFYDLCDSARVWLGI
jgi:hypothetical protein